MLHLQLMLFAGNVIDRVGRREGYPKLGDYFTGGTGSVLYLDEFAFLYKAAK